ncbi:lytic transglycosylase domain-containing protein [Lysinibacillus piscis]|uniref:Transglycosylase SLT domain-containing protein n=1 Tax=Lysinibacillus piscis TaxID=2518931 RepID=A0ABQ5NLI4_9BACI|nr:lytic transglycosylase domain-containing protein [Lysinibacillus sp. KH24]GLC89215.1 hypothetical protein LYSBPC_23420 [Lysinibacillus sp. KH24]
MEESLKKEPLLSSTTQLRVILLLLPIALTMCMYFFFTWNELQVVPIFEKLTPQKQLAEIQQHFDMAIPEPLLPIYMAAEEKYHVPWTLLAAHHRIETRFSTLKSLISPVGATGHMQFMPCTFVGWQHPTCSGLGKGNIPQEELTNPAAIKKYGGYGIDGNGDGVADPYNMEDAIFSAAHYLAKNGAADGKIEQAVFQYNHSDEYVEKVLEHFMMYNEYHDEMRAIVLAKTTK